MTEIENPATAPFQHFDLMIETFDKTTRLPVEEIINGGGVATTLPPGFRIRPPLSPLYTSSLEKGRTLSTRTMPLTHYANSPKRMDLAKYRIEVRNHFRFQFLSDLPSPL
jgi:hypothetical protein